MSEKVLLRYNPTCMNQGQSNNNNRIGSWRPCQREFNYIEEDVRYYANDLNDRNVKPIVYKVDMD